VVPVTDWAFCDTFQVLFSSYPIFIYAVIPLFGIQPRYQNISFNVCTSGILFLKYSSLYTLVRLSDDDIKSFRSHYGPGVDSSSNRNENQEYFLGGKGGRCVRLTTLPPSCAAVTKSGNLNFLEPSGSVQACNGTDLPLPFFNCIYKLYIVH
jgi:hypothetical protein